MSIIKKISILLLLAIIFDAIYFLLAWADHLYIEALNPFLAVCVLSVFLLIAIPLGSLAVKKIARYYKGRLTFDPATLFALGFFIFVIGNIINEITFGPSSLDIQLHDTYFVIAHAHIMSFLALIFLLWSAVYTLFPRITGRVMNLPMGYLHFGITLLGSSLLCWPTYYTGLAGMLRRYYSHSEWVNFDQFATMNSFKLKVTIGLIITQLIFIVNLIYVVIKGKKY